MNTETKHRKIIEIVQDKLTCSAHNLGSVIADDILRNLEYEEDKIEKTKHCIISHRFRTRNKPNSIEAKIPFDSDKLDVIGASGFARTFMLAGQFWKRLTINKSLNDNLKFNTVENGRLKDVSKHTPFIEYEVKLKKIPDKLYT
ncbi:phosphohydrolase [Clostridium sp. C8-1-8]|uniref:HD domain-containing protein n=1 Tax=Clostridium sp. C8-1-8 TaxID=2698831 RepID=UPI00325FD1E2